MEINLVPDIMRLPHIYEAHKNGKLVIFVGAGVSAVWGCKRWKDMAIALIDACYENEYIDYWSREALLRKYISSPRKLITISKAMLNDKYVPTLKHTLKVHRKDKFPDLFTNLASLNATFITTNIDDNLSCLFDKGSVCFDRHKLSSFSLKPKNIFHLHGIIHEPKSLIMTIDEYLQHYQDHTVKDFLEDLFHDEKNCLLFVGYGVDEMEIIDYMIEKYSEGLKDLKKYVHRFYILLPFFQNEKDLLPHEETYFSQINMSVVPYAIDVKGYDQLYEIINIWKSKMLETDQGDEFYKLNKVLESNL